MMTRVQIINKFSDLSIDELRLHISALTELLTNKLALEEKQAIADKKGNYRQITIMEALEKLNRGGKWET